MTEANLMRLIQVKVARLGVRLFRNNVGQAWIGKSKRYMETQTVTVNQGDVVIRAARPFHAGLCDGSSDLIGWRSITITEKHIGKNIAQFVASEIKLPDGRVNPDQSLFLTTVKNHGGHASIIRSIEQAIEEFSD